MDVTTAERFYVRYVSKRRSVDTGKQEDAESGYCAVHRG